MEGSVMMPFLGHPEFLLHRMGAGGVGEPERTIGVAFVGNCDGRMYSSFGKVPRARAKKVVIDKMGKDVVCLRKIQDKLRLRDWPAIGVLFVDRSELGLNVAEYAEVLRRSKFFLVLPGIESDVTHSLHECLISGCVPILTEGSEVGDGWKNGVNCLSFSDEESLYGAVRSALGVTDQQLLELQSGAQQQLNRCFSERQFLQAMCQKGIKRILVCNC
jgi:hypothetical protein